MAEMIRKQIYITRRQEQMLKRLSQARGISEAEIVRSAINRELHGENINQGLDRTHPSGLADFIRLARSDRELNGEPTRWNRSDLYTERENRWPHQVSDAEDENAPSVD